MAENHVTNGAAHSPEPQPNVISATRKHGLFLWIHLSPEVDARRSIKDIIHKVQDFLTPSQLTAQGNTDTVVGFGFGPKFYASLGKEAPRSFDYPERKSLPSTGGDIFIHAKSDSQGSLFDLSKQLSDVYGFEYRSEGRKIGRDVSGFIDGTANPSDLEDRRRVALDHTTGGSFCVTQKWVHDLKVIHDTPKKNLDHWIGRDLKDGKLLPQIAPTAHIARMTSGPDRNKPFEIVRQSMPCGSVSADPGLFFIAFAASPQNFDFMLDRMVGGKDGQEDEILSFKMSECVQGTYWYFPSKDELDSLAA